MLSLSRFGSGPTGNVGPVPDSQAVFIYVEETTHLHTITEQHSMEHFQKHQQQIRINGPISKGPA